MNLFWKGFNRSRCAGKLLNEANDRWQQRQRFLLSGDEEQAQRACVEVIRLCQLSIEADQRMGDAYVLLANALSSASSHGPGNLGSERYEVLLSTAAAVIHLWYSLPHRGSHTTKNTAIGEQLWRVIFDEVKEHQALAEDASLALMDSYRDSLAAETISPASFAEIQGVIVRTAAPSDPSETQPQEPLEQMLPSEIWDFLAECMLDVVKKQSDGEHDTTDKPSRVESALKVFRSHRLVPSVQSVKYL